MSPRTRTALAVAGGLVVSAWLVSFATRLPPVAERPPAAAQADTSATRLGAAIAPLAAAHPGMSGIHALYRSGDAFAARVHLAREADRSLDMQYYIWRIDRSGCLLLDELRAAADRGVHVRLLLDDHNTAGLDPTLAALDAHANIEVRLFNPFATRSFRALGYLSDFSRLNRRMHNKSFTADGQATIIGGRNVGDEYFAAADGTAFVDLDVMAVGAVAAEVSADFDRYWQSASSYPVGELLPPADRSGLEALHAAAAATARDPAARGFMEALAASTFVRELEQRSLPLEWTRVRMVSDDPAKGLGLAPPEAMLPAQLEALIGRPARSLELVSAYFVPGAGGVDAFDAMAKRGVRVSVLTNAFEATDVAVVHGGYARRRKDLLRSDIRLFELRREAAGEPERAAVGSGSSASSLHAKTFAVDGQRVFVGSFNFDPRSIDLNTEIGFVIDSPSLAQKIDSAFTGKIPARSYEARLDDDGSLYWIEHRDGKLVRHDTEPGTTAWQRFALGFFSLLPVEWLL